MAKVVTQIWSCDGPGCSAEYKAKEDDDSRYWSVPPGWIELAITSINEDEQECLCKCHEEDCDDDGDNVAGHESYDCEVCPDEDDYEMSGTYCESCAKKFQMMFGLPKNTTTATGLGRIV
jgi:hypothetical protein